MGYQMYTLFWNLSSQRSRSELMKVLYYSEENEVNSRIVSEQLAAIQHQFGGYQVASTSAQPTAYTAAAPYQPVYQTTPTGTAFSLP